VGKRLGLVVLVAALSITSLGLGDKKQMGDDLVAIAGPAIAFPCRDVVDVARARQPALGQFFVTIVERYDGDGATALDEAVAGRFAQVRSRSFQSKDRRSRSNTAPPRVARSGWSTTSGSTA
jgi:hypothetical protein